MSNVKKALTARLPQLQSALLVLPAQLVQATQFARQNPPVLLIARPAGNVSSVKPLIIAQVYLLQSVPAAALVLFVLVTLIVRQNMELAVILIVTVGPVSNALQMLTALLPLQFAQETPVLLVLVTQFALQDSLQPFLTAQPLAAVLNAPITVTVRAFLLQSALPATPAQPVFLTQNVAENTVQVVTLIVLRGLAFNAKPILTAQIQLHLSVQHQIPAKHVLVIPFAIQNIQQLFLIVQVELALNAPPTPNASVLHLLSALVASAQHVLTPHFVQQNTLELSHSAKAEAVLSVLLTTIAQAQLLLTVIQLPTLVLNAPMIASAPIQFSLDAQPPQILASLALTALNAHQNSLVSLSAPL